MEEDVKPSTKTRKRTEDAVADRAKHGDSSPAKRVDTGPTGLTSFGKIAEPSLALLCRDDAQGDKGAKAPRPCLSVIEMRTPPVAGGLLPAGTASTAITIIFSGPISCWTLGEETKERISRTGRKHLAIPCWRRVIKNKSRRTLVFDPGGS